MGLFDKLFGSKGANPSAEELGQNLALLALAQVDVSRPSSIFRNVKAFLGTPTSLKAAIQQEWLIFALFTITVAVQQRLDGPMVQRTLDALHRATWDGLERCGMPPSAVTQIERHTRRRYAEFYDLLKAPNPGMALTATIVNNIYGNPVPNEPPPGVEFDTTMEVMIQVQAFSQVIAQTLGGGQPH